VTNDQKRNLVGVQNDRGVGVVPAGFGDDGKQSVERHAGERTDAQLPDEKDEVRRHRRVVGFLGDGFGDLGQQTVFDVVDVEDAVLKVRIARFQPPPVVLEDFPDRFFGGFLTFLDSLLDRTDQILIVQNGQIEQNGVVKRLLFLFDLFGHFAEPTFGFVESAP